MTVLTLSKLCKTRVVFEGVSQNVRFAKTKRAFLGKTNSRRNSENPKCVPSQEMSTFGGPTWAPHRGE
jgi:hypothetical protein